MAEIFDDHEFTEFLADTQRRQETFQDVQLISAHFQAVLETGGISFNGDDVKTAVNRIDLKILSEEKAKIDAAYKLGKEILQH